MANNTSIPPNTTVTDVADTTNGFLLWWTNLIHIVNVPLSIFILVLVCIGLLLLLIILICICRACCKRTRLQRRPKRRVRALYLDQIPGLTDSEMGKYGSLEYSLEYNMKKNELKVGLVQGIDLHSQPGMGLLDPYVKVRLETMPTDENVSDGAKLMPVLSKTFKTNVKTQCNSPCWNETFIFKLQYTKLKYTTVTMGVYDYDTHGLDSVVGQLRIDLKEVDLANYMGKTLELTDWLEKGDEVDLGTGDLCIVLKQSQTDNTLHVTVLEAKRLKLDEKRLGCIPDTYVTVKLHVGKKNLATKQTAVRHSTKTPYFGDVLIFAIKPAKLTVAGITCKLKYKTKLGIKRVLGKVEIGQDAESAGSKQWMEMLEDPKRAVAMWHPMFGSSKKELEDT